MAIKGKIANVAIRGIACAVPADKRDNLLFVERFGEEQMSKFEKMVGVKERRFSRDCETTADLSYASAVRLKDNGLFSSDNVDAILFVCQTPNRVLPATACE